MKLVRTVVLLLAAVLLAAGVAACSDDDDGEENGGDETAPTTQAAATTAAADGGGGASTTVEAADFSFDPDTFTVAAGEAVTVTLTNSGNVTHTLTVYTDEEYTEAVEGADTDFVSAGENGEFTATFDAGEYFFRCEVHPSQMQGEFQAE